MRPITRRHRRLPSFAVAAAVAVVMSLAFAPGAFAAAAAGVVDGVAVLEDDGDSSNATVLRNGSNLQFENDTGITPVSGCSALDSNTVQCGSGDAVEAYMGDGTDSFRIDEDGGDFSVYAEGEGGNDTLGEAALSTFTGDTELHGGPGNDTLYASEGPVSSLFGEDGNDQLYAGFSHDAVLIRGGNGNDLVQGASGPDTLHGDAGDDTVKGFDGNDHVYGDAGNDTVNGNAGNDYVDGGPGADSIGGDTDLSDDGNDTIQARDGTRDSVSCFFGTDTVTADRIDTIDRLCDTVLLPPVASTPGPSADCVKATKSYNRARKAYKRAKARLKKAKKAFKKHHTHANAKRVKSAKKKYKKALKKYKKAKKAKKKAC